jgi:uncharacterized protein (TIGR03083 family)
VSDLLGESYARLTRTVEGLAPRQFLLPTRADGWCLLDLLFHLLLDAQRALVALATPEAGSATTDTAAYFRRPLPDAGRGAGELDHARFVRVAASAYARPEGLVRHWRNTSEAAARAVAAADPAALVGTQGHVLTVADLAETLVIEAAVHHLDLTVRLPDDPGPPPQALALVRRTLAAQLGGPLPTRWDDTEAALKGSGRLPLSVEDRAALGTRADGFPLLG